MGIGPKISGSYDTYDNCNPDPSSFQIIERHIYQNAAILKVKYFNCTNFEGIKILVFKGEFKETDYLDPHFCEDNNLIARFRPTKEGMKLANKLVKYLEKNNG